MHLAGGLGIGVLLLVAGCWMVRRLHSLPSWFSAGLLLVIAGLVAIVAALSGATIGDTLAITGFVGFVFAFVKGMYLLPRDDSAPPGRD